MDDVWRKEADALLFASEDKTYWAFAQATQMHEERAERCRAVRARLGLPELVHEQQ